MTKQVRNRFTIVCSPYCLGQNHWNIYDLQIEIRPILGIKLCLLFCNYKLHFHKARIHINFLLVIDTHITMRSLRFRNNDQGQAWGKYQLQSWNTSIKNPFCRTDDKTETVTMKFHRASCKKAYHSALCRGNAPQSQCTDYEQICISH